MQKIHSQNYILFNIEKLGRKISKDLRDEQDVIFVCNLNGGFMFFSDLLKNISIDLTVGFIETKRYPHGETWKIETDLRGLNLNGKTIVLVEDIIDSGKTLLKLREQIEEEFKDTKFISVSLLVRGESETLVDYYCFRIVGPQFVVGYGMDDEDGLKRNLPDIYLLD